MFSICVLLHVVPGALWADYILSILDESLPNHGDLALVTKEALIVPSQGLEGHKFCAAQTSLACYWFGAGIASLRE